MNKRRKPSRPQSKARSSRSLRHRVVPRTPVPLYRWAIHEKLGTVTITGPGQVPVLKKFWVEIELGNDDVLTTCQSGLAAGPGFWGAELANGSIGLELVIKRSVDPAGVCLAVTVRNRGKEPLAVKEIRIARTVMDRSPEGWGPVAGWRILRMGFAPGDAHREDHETGSSSLVTLAAEDSGARSWGSVAVGLPGPAGGLVAGFLTSGRQMAWLDIRNVDGSVDLSAACETTGDAVPPGGALTTETLYLALTDNPAVGLADYARLAGRRGGVKPKPAPRGWSSRYLPGSLVAEDAILEHARFIAERRKELPLDIVLLDGGFAKAFGDWLETNDTFPQGLEWLGGKIAELGLTPGIGLAPFAVSASSRLFKEHGEWMVKDSASRPLAWEAEKDTGGPWYALDGSHPEVQGWLAHVFAILRGYGFAYFRLDLLFMGCIPGVRSRPGTRVSAYRHGLAAIREGAGDSYILGSGAPYHPSIGLVDGMRVSRDAHLPAGPWESFHASFRETHQRFWSHRALWNNDSDALVLRATEGTPDGLIGALAASATLSGGAVFSGDVLPDLPPDRLELLARILATARDRAAVPLDLFNRECPRMLVASDGGGKFRAGLFNDGAVARSAVLDLGLLGLNRARILRTDGVRPEDMGPRWRSVLLPPVPGRGAITLDIQEE
jgi:hypothetical protein